MQKKKYLIILALLIASRQQASAEPTETREVRGQGSALCFKEKEACDQARSVLNGLASKEVSVYTKKCDFYFHYKIECGYGYLYSFGIPEVRVSE